MNIRGKTISYSCLKKKLMSRSEIELENKINRIEQEIQSNFLNISLTAISNLDESKRELENIRNDRLKGNMIHSRAEQIRYDGKPTKYFLHLEKQNFTNKQMTKLVNDDNVVVTDPEKVADMQRQFYEKLYSKERNLPDREHIREKLDNLNTPALPDHISESLGKLYMQGLTEALKNNKNNKSPSIDGYPIEFFNFFWKDLGIFVLNALNFSYVTGNLSISLERGVITCIPKQNKCRFYLKNWRPISLLNAVYKLAASCIANRIKPVLCEIINEDQKGFIRGRYIGENIRMVFDALFYAQLQQKPGLLLLIDFEKAFDSISWDFLHEVIKKFNFGPSMQKWVHLFYNDIQSCVLQNGFLSSFFSIGRDCRQGDPLSPYLFTLAVEILAIMI